MNKSRSSEGASPSVRHSLEEASTFRSIFYPRGQSLRLRVPDYQRAYAWEEMQIDLFISDLVKYSEGERRYYFGHFIAENGGDYWDIVDGQQRITTFVLFLLICRHCSPFGNHAGAYSLIERFSTASYDDEALKMIGGNLDSLFETSEAVNGTKLLSDNVKVEDSLTHQKPFTNSQRRMELALLRIRQAFEKGKLTEDKIDAYIAVVMDAYCSHLVTPDKAVAVSIFEMHNTRGIPLTTLEIIKASLMRHVYDNCPKAESNAKVGLIQKEFSDIYAMEEQVAMRTFRGEMTMDQIVRLHLRMVDDGAKGSADDFDRPAENANAQALIEYVNTQLRSKDEFRVSPEGHNAGVQYALDLARELRKSVQIMTQTLPEWDVMQPLVGDVLIFEPNLSFEFFLRVCRFCADAQSEEKRPFWAVVLKQWERLLFTRDFHAGYYKKRQDNRDQFPRLFEKIGTDEQLIEPTLRAYLKDGFRKGAGTDGLQSLVRAYLTDYRGIILKDTFNWGWKHKMIHVIYKYELSKRAKLREVMKSKLSVEHLAPQGWEGIEKIRIYLDSLDDRRRQDLRNELQACIHGLGNLLLISSGDSSGKGDDHPADKCYEKYGNGGSYAEHNLNRDLWNSLESWGALIKFRGEAIFNFMMTEMVGGAEVEEPTAPFNSATYAIADG